MEEEKGYVNVVLLNKVLVIIFCDQIKEILGYFKVIYRKIYFYLFGEK